MAKSITYRKTHNLTVHLSIIALISSIAMLMAGCTLNVDTPRDESFISFTEVDEMGEKRYYDKELFIYTDSCAILNTADNILSVYKVTLYTDGEYRLVGVSRYDGKGPKSIIEGEKPQDLTVSFDYLKNQWSIEGKDISFGTLKRQFRKTRTYYNNAHVLHDNLARQALAVDDDTPATTQPAPEVPITPDYSNGSSMGTLNTFTPGNYNEFVQYNLGIILGVMCIVGFIILFFGNGGYSEDSFSNRHQYSAFFYICLIFTTIVTVFELQAFCHNPAVLFQSDFPLFGCLGRVICFCALSIMTVNISRHLEAAIEYRYNLYAIRFGFIFTIIGLGAVLWRLVTLLNIPPDPSLVLPVILPSAGILWTLGAIKLIRIIIKGRGCSLVTLLYYLVIYPWSFIQMIFGGAFALLGKIAREKPDNDYEHVTDPDHQYVTDALGNGAYLHRIGDNQWIDTKGNLFSQSGKTMTRLSDNRQFF